jgi:hypothetical protein
MTTAAPRRPRLAAWLTANSFFSVGSGAAIALASPLLPELLGVGGRILYLAVGIGLVLYGAWLWTLARGAVKRAEGVAVVVGDVVWVVGSAALVASGALTPEGTWIVAAAAGVVGVFAIGQWRALPA